MTKKKKNKGKIQKPYNAGTMTSNMFFSWIRSHLRRISMRGWRPLGEVRRAAQVDYKGENKRRKYSYICSKCEKEVDGKSCAVHHVTPVGSLKSFEDLADFCKRLFVEKEGLILLCNDCHEKEHKKLKDVE